MKQRYKILAEVCIDGMEELTAEEEVDATGIPEALLLGLPPLLLDAGVSLSYSYDHKKNEGKCCGSICIWENLLESDPSFRKTIPSIEESDGEGYLLIEICVVTPCGKGFSDFVSVSRYKGEGFLLHCLLLGVGISIFESEDICATTQGVNVRWFDSIELGCYIDLVPIEDLPARTVAPSRKEAALLSILQEFARQTNTTLESILFSSVRLSSDSLSCPDADIEPWDK